MRRASFPDRQAGRPAGKHATAPASGRGCISRWPGLALAMLACTGTGHAQTGHAQGRAGPDPAAAPLAAPLTATATLEVTVANVRSGRGFVRVAVCPKASFLQPSCPWKGSAPAQSGSVVVTIAGVPPGLYAAQAYQDETDIRSIPRTLFGIPEVGIGFSNDAPFRFGPPRFGDAAFQVGAGGGVIGLRLRYFN